MFSYYLTEKKLKTKVFFFCFDNNKSICITEKQKADYSF